jgi:hypothetical protein
MTGVRFKKPTLPLTLTQRSNSHQAEEKWTMLILDQLIAKGGLKKVCDKSQKVSLQTFTWDLAGGCQLYRISLLGRWSVSLRIQAQASGSVCHPVGSIWSQVCLFRWAVCGHSQSHSHSHPDLWSIRIALLLQVGPPLQPHTTTTLRAPTEYPSMLLAVEFLPLHVLACLS